MTRERNEKARPQRLIGKNLSGEKLLSVAIRMALGGASILCAATVSAGPSGENIVGGSGNVSRPNTSTTLIRQASQRLAIDWRNFDVGVGERVRFEQPNANSTALNRILNQNPTQILGSVSANGRIVLLNPNGLIIGPGGTVNAAAVVAAGMDANPNDFMAGRLSLSGVPNAAGAVVNRGTIEASTGGTVALVGKSVANEGLILAQRGTVALAAGNRATVDFEGDGLLQIAVDEAVLDNLEGKAAAVENSGTIQAAGGQVLMTAAAARDVFSKVVVNSGLVTAGRVENVGGVIRLVAAGDGAVAENSGVLDASSTTGDSAGEIGVLGDSVQQAGVIRANSESGAGGKVVLAAEGTALLSGDSVIEARAAEGQGGVVHVTGERVGLLDNSMVDVSGGTGGGEALIGGDVHGENPEIQNSTRTVVGRGASVIADALTAGDGGKVVLWADGDTVFHGTVSAQGGTDGGDGGFVEVSGKERLGFDGDVDVRAHSEGGVVGNLLLDPSVINVTNAAIDTGDDSQLNPDVPNTTPDGPAGVILAGDGGAAIFSISKNKLEAVGATASVRLQASSAINFASGITLNLTQGLTLDAPTINADGNLTIFAASIDLEGNLEAAGQLTLTATSATGDIDFQSKNVTVTAADADVNLNAGRNILGGNIFTEGGTVELTAGTADVSSAGNIGVLGITTTANDASGANVTLLTSGGLTVSDGIKTGAIDAGTGAVKITSASHIALNLGGSITIATTAIAGASAELSAGTSIFAQAGQSPAVDPATRAALQTSVDTLQAHAGSTSGIIIIENDKALTLEHATNDTLHSVSAGQGVDVSTSNGTLTINDSVATTGSGDVTLAGQLSVTLKDLVVANNGARNVTITSIAGNILDGSDSEDANVFAAHLDLEALRTIGGSGALDLDTEVSSLTVSTTATNSTAGLVQIENTGDLEVTSVTTAEGGNVNVTLTANEVAGANPGDPPVEAGNITLGTITATGNTVTLVAAGDITDGSSPSEDANVIASHLDLEALRTIGGSGAADLDTEVTSLTVSTTATDNTAGRVQIENTGDLEVTNVTTAAGGNVNVTLTANEVAGANPGDPPVEAGNITLGTITATDNTVTLVAAGDIADGSSLSEDANVVAAHLDLEALRTIGGSGAADLDTEVSSLEVSTTATNNTAGLVQIENTGDLEVTSVTTAEGGNVNVTLTANEVAGANPGDLPVEAGDITLGTIAATGNTVTLVAAGDIVDGNDTPSVTNNVTSDILDMTASNSIGGATDDPIETNVNQLSARTTDEDGLVFIGVSNNGDLEINEITTAGDGDTDADPDAVDVAVSTTNGGDIEVVEVNAVGNNVELHAAGDITDGSSPSEDANVVAAHLDLMALRTIGGSGAADLDTEVSSLEVSTTATNNTAGLVQIENMGDLEVTSVTTAEGGNVNVTLTANEVAGANPGDPPVEAGDITLGTITATGNTVTLVAAGDIVDGNDTPSVTNNVTANVLDMTASNSIGGATDDPIETNVNQLSARTTDEDGLVFIGVSNNGDLEINEITTAGDGDTDADPDAVDVAVSTTNGGDIEVVEVNAVGNSVELHAAGDITDGSSPSEDANVVAAHLDLMALRTIGGSGAADLDTEISSLTVSTTATNNTLGTVQIENTGDLEVTNVTTADGGNVNVQLTANEVAGANPGDDPVEAGDITLGTVTAVGNTVTLFAGGAVEDNNGSMTNINARNLEIDAESVTGSGEFGLGEDGEFDDTRNGGTARVHGLLGGISNSNVVLLHDRNPSTIDGFAAEGLRTLHADSVDLGSIDAPTRNFVVSAKSVRGASNDSLFVVSQMANIEEPGDIFDGDFRVGAARISLTSKNSNISLGGGTVAFLRGFTFEVSRNGSLSALTDVTGRARLTNVGTVLVDGGHQQNISGASDVLQLHVEEGASVVWTIPGAPSDPLVYSGMLEQGAIVSFLHQGGDRATDFDLTKFDFSAWSGGILSFGSVVTFGDSFNPDKKSRRGEPRYDIFRLERSPARTVLDDRLETGAMTLDGRTLNTAHSDLLFDWADIDIVSSIDLPEHAISLVASGLEEGDDVTLSPNVALRVGRLGAFTATGSLSTLTAARIRTDEMAFLLPTDGGREVTLAFLDTQRLASAAKPNFVENTAEFKERVLTFFSPVPAGANGFGGQETTGNILQRNQVQKLPALEGGSLIEGVTLVAQDGTGIALPEDQCEDAAACAPATAYRIISEGELAWNLPGFLNGSENALTRGTARFW